MRSLTTTDFELTNVEYIQFWMLDPFNEDQDPNGTNSGGDLYFNLGNLSEESCLIRERHLKMVYRLTKQIFKTLIIQIGGKVSTQQVVVNAFDNDPNSRSTQDVGLDGY